MSTQRGRFVKLQADLCVALALACLLPTISTAKAADITDEDFKQLKELVIKQGQRLDQLEKLRDQDQKTIENDQKTHQQDQQEIQRLKKQIEGTQPPATQPQPKAEAEAPQVQPVHAVPESSAATHNFTMVGDAEVQFGKVDGSHSAFALADFAPILLFRARDNILFEAGLDEI